MIASNSSSSRALTNFRLLLLSLVTILGTQGSLAWTPLTTGGSGNQSGTVSRWNLETLDDERIPYFINPNRPEDAVPLIPADVTEEEIIDEVFAVFRAFTEAQGAEVQFRYEGTTEVDFAGDQMNVITFVSEGFDFPNESGLFTRIFAAIDPGPVQLAPGLVVQAQEPGQILDADVLVDPQVAFSVGLEQPIDEVTFDLRGALTSAISTMIGVDGSGLASSVFYLQATLGQAFPNRELSQDDEIAFASLYPDQDFLSSTGQIRGTITDEADDVVFGAHVVAIDAATGVVITSTLSGLSETGADGLPQQYSTSSGDYLLTGLPPGDYRVLVQPLDAPGEPVLAGVFGNGLDTLFVNASFQPFEIPGTTTVTAGEVTVGVSASVDDATPTSPIINPAIFVTDSSGTAFTQPVRLSPGDTRTLSVGGINLQDGATLIAGSTATAGSTDVSLGQLTAREADILIPITVSPDALPGPRVLTIANNNGSTVLPGGIVILPTPNPDVLPLAAILPASRSVMVGDLATVFATVINAGAVDALGCRISPITAVSGDFSFQATDPVDNAPVGAPNQLVDIAAGSSQTFIIAIQPTAAQPSTSLQLQFVCGDVDEAPSLAGLNTLQLAVSDSPVADVIALGATVNGNGIVDIPVVNGTGFFSVATINLGSSALITASVDTGATALPANLSICQTNPDTGACINPTAPSPTPVMATIEANETPTFAVFVQGQEAIGLDPAANRVFVRFTDENGVETGSTSVAVQTLTEPP